MLHTLEDGEGPRLLVFPWPVAAAINGHAMAGGWVIACASDYRMMTTGRGKGG